MTARILPMRALARCPPFAGPAVSGTVSSSESRYTSQTAAKYGVAGDLHVASPLDLGDGQAVQFVQGQTGVALGCRSAP